jgi:hypothetical protein
MRKHLSYSFLVVQHDRVSMQPCGIQISETLRVSAKVGRIG